MFTESPEGKTHYQNDGCGEPAHNSMPQKSIEEFEKKIISKMEGGFLSGRRLNEIKSFLLSALAQQKEEVKKGIGEIRDKVHCAKCDGSTQLEHTQRCKALSDVIKLIDEI